MAALAVVTTIADARAAPLVSPYDAIVAAYEPYLAEDDSLAMPMKLRSLAGSEYKFWRGSKDLFFAWAKEHCADWKADRAAYRPCHGDLHFGNIGDLRE